MNPYALPLFAVAGVFLVGAGGAALWHQRRYIQHLQALLAHNEQARRALAEQLLALRQRLDAGSDAIVSDLDSDLAARRREMERIIAAGTPVDDRNWQPTQPFEGSPGGDVDVVLTRPGELAAR